MTGRFEYSLDLMGTSPGGLAEATVSVTSGTLSMNRSWTPAVSATVTVPYAAFDETSWPLIEPTLSAKYGRLQVSDLDAGRLALWRVSLRSYRHIIGAGDVELTLRSFESVVMDYGRTLNSVNYTDAAAFPSTLSIVRALCQYAAGADVAPAGDWTADQLGTPGPSNEYRFVVPGSEPWDYVQALAAHTPGGIVQHYGYSNNLGDSLHWLLTHPTYERVPSFPYTMPVEPSPALGLSQGSVPVVEWQAERSREADGWGDAMYVEYPAQQTAGSAVFTSSGYVMDYEYNDRGTAGSSLAGRRQAKHVSHAWSTPEPGAERNTVAAQRLTRAGRRAVGQTFTVPLDTRLLPWQVHADENSVLYMIDSVTHNLTGGTSVVSVNRI